MYTYGFPRDNQEKCASKEPRYSKAADNQPAFMRAPLSAERWMFVF